MKKILAIFYFLCLYLWMDIFCFAQEDVALEPIVVTPTRMPEGIGEVLRDVTVIDAAEIRSLAAHSIEEVLKYTRGVDIQERAPYGVQSDVTIRGSTFSQVLILVDGIRVNDPQTAHYSLDLGLPLESVERIEILRGHGSSLYGTDSFGGVVNIITKTPREREAYGGVSFGSHRTSIYSLGFSDKGPNLGSSFFLERKKSDGYRYDTDFDIFNLSSKTVFEIPQVGRVDFLLSYMDKEFGANDFYGASPSKEWTDTLFVNLGAEFGEKIKMKPGLFYRRHKDKYVWTIVNPGLSVNYHTTDVFGAKFDSIIPSKFGGYVLGVEGAEEEIDSSNIGDHHVSRCAVYAENKISIENFTTNLGIRLDYYSNFKWEYSPTISLGYKLSPSFRLRSSVGKAFRVPSFTDRYYIDRNNIGNQDLDPEEAWSYEVGANYQSFDNKMCMKTTLFWRDEDKVIDWIAPDTSKAGTETNPWQAENIGKVEIGGAETTFEITPTELVKFSFNYTFMDSDSELPQGYVSKYALRHPEHQLGGGVNCKLPLGIEGSLKGRYTRRVHESGYRVFDLRLFKRIAGGEVFLEVNNIFAEDYEEISGVPMPGRWIQSGVKFSF